MWNYCSYVYEGKKKLNLQAGAEEVKTIRLRNIKKEEHP